MGTEGSLSFPRDEREVTWTNATFLDSRHINRIRWMPTPWSIWGYVPSVSVAVMEIFRTLAR